MRGGVWTSEEGRREGIERWRQDQEHRVEGTTELGGREEGGRRGEGSGRRKKGREERGMKSEEWGRRLREGMRGEGRGGKGREGGRERR